MIYAWKCISTDVKNVVRLKNALSFVHFTCRKSVGKNLKTFSFPFCFHFWKGNLMCLKCRLLKTFGWDLKEADVIDCGPRNMITPKREWRQPKGERERENVCLKYWIHSITFKCTSHSYLCDEQELDIRFFMNSSRHHILCTRNIWIKISRSFSFDGVLCFTNRIFGIKFESLSPFETERIA